MTFDAFFSFSGRLAATIATGQWFMIHLYDLRLVLDGADVDQLIFHLTVTALRRPIDIFAIAVFANQHSSSICPEG